MANKITKLIKLGNNIKSARKEKGFSQNEFAKTNCEKDTDGRKDKIQIIGMLKADAHYQVANAMS